MAIDHNALIQVARRGYAVPLCTDHGQSYVPGYQANAPCPAYDVNAAKALLAQDGWTTKDQNWIFSNAQGQRLSSSTRRRVTTSGALMTSCSCNSSCSSSAFSSIFRTIPPARSSVPSLDGKAGVYDIAEFENAWSYDADDSSSFSSRQIPPNGFNINFYSNSSWTHGSPSRSQRRTRMHASRHSTRNTRST